METGPHFAVLHEKYGPQGTLVPVSTSICAAEQDMVFLSLLACEHRRFYGRLTFLSVGYESSGFLPKIIFSKII